MVSEDSLIKDVLNELNPNAHEMFSETIKMDVSRCLEVCVILLNAAIRDLYFPSFSQTIREQGIEASNILIEIRKEEYLMGLMIMVNMKYSKDKSLSKLNTDFLIENNRTFLQFIDDFFYYNTASPDLTIKQSNDLMKGYFFTNKYLPDLHFDPNFIEIFNSEALQFLYNVMSPSGGLELQERFMPSPDLMLSTIMQNPFASKLDIDRRFKLSLDTANINDYTGVILFGSEELIGECTCLFTQYYCNMIPRLKTEIEETLSCFKTLLLLMEGKTMEVFKYLEVRTSLEEKVSKPRARTFLDTFCMNKAYEKFPQMSRDFKADQIIEGYGSYLNYFGYTYLGQIYTGVFLIWRALLKYFEKLHREKEFYTQKGVLIEKYCFNVLEELGFEPKKVILKNSNLPKPPKYYKMRAQVKDFRDKTLKFTFPFPDSFKNSPFKEIDLLVKIKDLLFVFECKGTAYYKGTFPIFAKMYEYLKRDMRVNNERGDLLMEGLISGDIEHPYFEKKITIRLGSVIKTEGIITETGVLTIEGFTNYFRELREAIDTNSLEKFKEEFVNMDKKQ